MKISSLLAQGIIVFSILTIAASSTSQVPWETIERGQHSGIKKSLTRTIKSDRFFNYFMTTHNSNSFPAFESPPLPSVNFQNEIVAVVFLGDQNTGGHSVEVKSVVEKPHAIIVKYRRTYSDRNSYFTMAFEQPYHVIKMMMPPTIEGVQKEVRFVDMADNSRSNWAKRNQEGSYSESEDSNN